MKHRALSWLSAAALVFAGAVAADAQPTGPGSLAGFWVSVGYSHDGTFNPRAGVQLTTEGKMPPLQPWAAALLEKRIKDGEDGHPYVTTKAQCLPAGTPQMDFPPSIPVQILESPGQVTFLYEELGFYRVIPLNGKHRPDPDPSFWGDSVGHWEGDTLVVDTIGLTDRTTLDPIGMPHSDQLHTVERFRRTGKTGLEILVTIDDPKTFTAPWTAKAVFKTSPGQRLEEYYCENTRGISAAGGH